MVLQQQKQMLVQQVEADALVKNNNMIFGKQKTNAEIIMEQEQLKKQQLQMFLQQQNLVIPETLKQSITENFDGLN